METWYHSRVKGTFLVEIFLEIPSNHISLSVGPLPTKMGLSIWAEGAEKMKRMSFLGSPKIFHNTTTQFLPRFCQLSISLSSQCFEIRKWVLWPEWHIKRLCPGASSRLPSAPGCSSSLAWRCEEIRGKGLKEKRETQQPGSSYRKKGGGKRDSESNRE